MGLLDWLRGDPKAPADGSAGNDEDPEAEAAVADAPPPSAAGDRPAKAAAEKAAAEKPAAAAPKAGVEKGSVEKGSGEKGGADKAPAEKPAPEKAAPPRAARPLGEPRLVRVAMTHEEQAALEHIAHGVEAVLRIEQAVQPLVAMLQATAKAAARSDQERRQQFLDLRAHITGENDRLAETLRARIAEEAAIEVFRSIVPALDEIDHVLREKAIAEGRGLDSVRLVRRKLRDALSRLGVEEISIEEGVTQFDPELHEGKPHDGEGADHPEGTIARVDRTGYVAGEKVVRCALVTVVK